MLRPFRITFRGYVVRRLSLRCSLCVLSFLAFAGAASSSGGAYTREDRERVVAIAHKLEATPLDHALFSERDWAKQWVMENPEIRIRMCMQLMAGLRRPRHKFWMELTDQLMLSSATFLIEHPDQAGDHLAQSLAGMQSVLKAYTAILKTNPDAHAASLDDLLQKQSKGTLASWVLDTVGDCH
jgi:hypothetical protein